MNMINIIDAGKANALKEQGFNYRIQCIDKQVVFTFIESPELRKVLNENFSNRDFFISKTMNF